MQYMKIVLINEEDIAMFRKIIAALISFAVIVTLGNTLFGYYEGYDNVYCSAFPCTGQGQSLEMEDGYYCECGNDFIWFWCSNYVMQPP